MRKGNRAFFEHQLLDAIRANLKGLYANSLRVVREQGRFLIENTEGDLDTDAVLPRIKHIFGIAGFCHAVKTSAREIDELCVIGRDFFMSCFPSLANLTEQPSKQPSFRVETKRSDKNYPLLSTEISARIGDAIFTAGLGLKVELYKPDITLWVEIRNHVYFYINSETGEGGLPYGASGKGILLLSGGFDSPVAGFLAARRGVQIVAVYFHSPPFVSERAADKVRDLARELAKYTGRVILHIIPFTEIQLFLKENVSEQKLTIMLKRAMLHIAQKLADAENALCLITGDSVGQVASQTIHSLAAVESAVSLPILRPLATMDKQSILDIAAKIGTHDISVRPYEDCCTVFVAKHPENKPNAAAIEKAEARYFAALAPLMDNALKNAEICDLIIATPINS
ncbi:MAG: tRNA 4-thiouridine(8) synthase ThiI [Defluviitaleaceae bacterium]|nr:tRNA 4-thiouridine(8) synthase ThiI [Defluviitaleaceae bacterium]